MESREILFIYIFGDKASVKADQKFADVRKADFDANEQKDYDQR